MEHPDIDPHRYLQLPRLGVRSGLSLGRMLLAAVPEDPEPAVLAASERVGTRVAHLQTQWRAKERQRSAEDPRPADHRLDRAWSSIKASLERYGLFDPEDPDHRRATELRAQLFPAGLDFIQRPFVEQHAESQRRISSIDADGLRPDLDRLVGQRFVDELLAAHTAYGLALNITEASDTPAPVSLVAPLQALTDAITRYVLQVLAFAGRDPEHNNAPALRALMPIDVLRRASARRKARRGGEDMLDDQALADEMTSEEAAPPVPSPGETDDTAIDSDVASSAA